MARIREGLRLRGASRLIGRVARHEPRSRLRAIGVGAAAAGVVLLLRVLLSTYYGEASGFMILLPAVIVASLAAGPLGGIAALVACLLGGHFVVNLIDTGVSPFSNTRRVATANFVVVGLFATWVASALRKTIRDLDGASRARGESESRFALMADTAPSPIWMTDAEGRVEFVNQALVQFYGQPAAVILGDVWQATLHPHDEAAVAAIRAEHRPARRPYAFEARFRRADGAWRWMRCSVNPRFDPDGGFLGYVGMSFDLTEQRVALAEAQESEERFRAIADTAPVLIWVTAADRTREFVNEAYVRFMGGDYETVRTANWRDFIHPDDQDRLVAESVAGEATLQPFSLEARYLRADGEYRWLKSFSRPRFSPGGDVIGFVGVAFDVTDLRDANTRLTRVAAERDAILSQLAEGVIVTDPKGEILFVNEAASRIHGVTQLGVSPDGYADSYGLFTEDGDPYPPEQLPLSRAVLHQETVTDARWRIRRPDGSEVMAVGNARPVQGPDGERIGAVLTLRDETARIAAEQDLKRLNERLEERVGEALAEKAKAEADLMHAQRMEAVGRLTGGVAHDFNNLLTVVIGALDILLRTDDPAKRDKLGQAALSAARRGESLTHQLLAFSRRQALRPQAVDINAQIAEGELLLRRALGPHVAFGLDLASEPMRANVDPAQLEAALLNLIVNAGDAVGDAGRVTVSTVRQSVGEDGAPGLPPGDYVRLSVEDDGAGMSPEVVSRVFEPFFTTKPVGKGTGLGLSQVYGFARQSGGDVQVRSRLGEGTTISLVLPALGVDVAVAATEPVMFAAGATQGGRVLLVEDDPEVAAVAEELLVGLGFEVVTADGPQSALAALAQGAVDIMLTDLIMPGEMSGVELGRRVAADYPNVRIVLTSGYAGPDADRALAGAPWPFLHKPYSAEALGRCLAASR